MTINGGQHPEQDLRLKEQLAILPRQAGTEQQLHGVGNPGTTVRFIFQRWRHAQGLAKIFLRQTHQPPAAGPATVETLDNQHFLAAKGCHLSLCHWETKGFGNAQTQPFVFTTFAQVDIVLFYSADLQLKDVTGWGATLGPLPACLVP